MFIKRRVFALLAFTVILASILTGSYFLLEKFLSDQQSAMRHSTPIRRTPPKVTERTVTDPASPDARRSPNLPATNNAAAAGEAAIQRQLRTIEEINRMNEMNRRLMEQQRRMEQNR